MNMSWIQEDMPPKHTSKLKETQNNIVFFFFAPHNLHLPIIYSSLVQN